MSSDPMDIIVNALMGYGCNPKPQGKGYEARCPAHDDRTPSLSVRPGKAQGVAIKCFAGCTRDAVLAALGLTWQDVSDNGGRPAKERSEEVDVYRYEDENGGALFEVVRYRNPKKFPQRKPDGTWGVKGIRQVLYRLPQLIKAVAAAETIYIPEGEKDVHAIEREGAVATCNPGGADMWKADYNRYFTGANVVILADDDPPGHRHARDIYRHLQPVAESVQIMLPLEGSKDVADHLGRGRTLDELRPAPWIAEEDTDSRHLSDTDDDPDDDETSKPKKSIATQLVEQSAAHYDLGVSTDGLPFGLERDGPNVAHPLRGGRLGLRAALAELFMDVTDRAAPAGALADALLVIEGRCRRCDPTPLHIRVAPYGDGVVIDLGTPDGRAVVIEPTGWKVTDRSPVTFRRSELTMPLPEPVRTGLDLLAEPIGNVSKRSWPLVLGWLVAGFMPMIPHPIMLLRGEQGTGKSTMATALGALLDPTAAPLRSMPRDPEQWTVAASGSWLVALDNMSNVSPWLSDALCRAVTGEGTVRRKLYTDDDVSVIAFRRVIIMTAIDAGSLRGDLADRLLPVDLDTIEPGARRTDADLARQLADNLPGLFGALCDLVADVLAELPKVELKEMPRMADFARVLEAVGRVRTCVGQSPLSLYRGLEQDLAREVVEGDPFALAVAEMVKAKGVWTGTARDLGRAFVSGESRPRGWPTSPRAIGGAIGRLAPALRSIGIAVERNRTAGTNSRKTITLRLEGADDDPT